MNGVIGQSFSISGNYVKGIKCDQEKYLAAL